MDISPATKADHYEMIRRMLVKAKPDLADTTWLTKADIAPATYNKRLSYVKSCFLWALKMGKAEANPYADIKPRKASVTAVKPFSAEEIRLIIAGFEQQ